MKINLGDIMGLNRKINSDGRITIPKEFLRKLNINKNENVDIYLLKDGIYIKKGE